MEMKGRGMLEQVLEKASFILRRIATDMESEEAVISAASFFEPMRSYEPKRISKSFSILELLSAQYMSVKRVRIAVPSFTEDVTERREISLPSAKQKIGAKLEQRRRERENAVRSVTCK